MTNINQPPSVFIVGCSRGGTTLLQSILSSHPKYYSFPESNILYHVLDDLEFRRFGNFVGRIKIPKMYFLKLLNLLGYTNSFSNKYFSEFLNDVNRPELNKLLPLNTHSIKDIFRSFQIILETLSNGKPWIEKTPQNIFCLDLMSQHINNVQYIHIVRNGQDNVASLIDAANKYDTFRYRFGGKNGLVKAVNYWNSCIKISHKYRNHPSHEIVRFEDIVGNPLESLKQTADKLNIELHQNMLNYATTNIATKAEQWKIRDSNEISKPINKFDQIFSDKEKEYISTHIVNLDNYFPRQYN